MIDTDTIGIIIKKLRTKKGLTQEILAEKIDISTNYLSKIERGLSKLNIEAFLKMAQVLEFSLEDFGIKNSISTIDKTKEELFKRILILSEKKAKVYLQLFDIITELIKTLK